jgi:F-type H+-transporting ATPase subunit epsilon
MKTFKLYLQDATHVERIDDVVSFVGEDASGSFGVLAEHARMMTSLVLGLARYRTHDRGWQFVAIPGALLYFVDNELYLSTRRYLRDDNYERISEQLQQQLVAEEAAMRGIKGSLRRLEEEMLKRLWQLRAEERR